MTLNTYFHVLPGMQDDVAEKLDELLTPINVSEEINKLSEGKFAYPSSTSIFVNSDTGSSFG